jgi:hypothetical protein
MSDNTLISADPGSGEASGERITNRRQLLVRLGLLAGAAYAAPVLLQLSEAHASGSGGGKGSGKKGSGKKGSGNNGRRRRRRRRRRGS